MDTVEVVRHGLVAERWRRRVLGCLVAGSMGVFGLAVGEPSASGSGLPTASDFNCPAHESFPPANTPRNAPGAPYRIPFTGTINGGVLRVGAVGATQSILGPVNAKFCGLITLPGQSGVTESNQLVVTNNPVPISAGIMGIQIFGGYVQLQGTVSAQINPVPAANGGINLDLSASFAATLVPTVGLSTILSGLNLSLPVTGTICTTTVGPMHMTTTTSGKLHGQPLTGPIAAAQALVVANDYTYPAISADTPPVTTTPPPPGGGCSPAVATTLNSLLGLPNPPGVSQFTAPLALGVHVTQ